VFFKPAGEGIDMNVVIPGIFITKVATSAWAAALAYALAAWLAAIARGRQRQNRPHRLVFQRAATLASVPAADRFYTRRPLDSPSPPICPGRQ